MHTSKTTVRVTRLLYPMTMYLKCILYRLKRVALCAPKLDHHLTLGIDEFHVIRFVEAIMRQYFVLIFLHLEVK